MNVTRGGYHVGDIEVFAAFDVSRAKVGRDVAEAIQAPPNNTHRFAEVAATGVPVERGMTMDGLGRYLTEEIEKSPRPPADVRRVLERTRTDVVVCYLPVGSERAVQWYAEQALDAGCAFVNCIPVFIASRPQAALDALFIEPAQQRPERRFLIGGAQYPHDFPWSDNIFFVRHLPPQEHPAFFSSSRLTLNVTRQAMASMGWCPSGRLLKARGAAILSDWWPGLDTFFDPGREIIVAHDSADAVDALGRDDAELRRLGERARAGVLAEHTSQRRAAELEAALAQAGASPPPAMMDA